MDEEKYNECKRTIKIWEKQFKKTHGRIPSKHDFREAERSIREAYRTYCRLKTALLEETLRDVLDEDSFDASQFADGESQAPFELPREIPTCVYVEEEPEKKVFEAEVEVNKSDVWGSELNKKKKTEAPVKPIPVESLPVPKLNAKKRFSMRNPRKSLNRTNSKPNNSQNSLSFSQGESETLPDLETILMEKAKRHDIENVPKNANLTNTKNLVNTVDVGWLNRRDPDTPVAVLSSQGPTSFGMSSLRINSNLSVPQNPSVVTREAQKFEPESDSDEIIANSDTESTMEALIQRRSMRHVMKRRKLEEKEPVLVEKVPETPKTPKKAETPVKMVARTPTRRSVRNTGRKVTPVNNDVSEEEPDPFACDDDSDKDPPFKKEPKKVKTRVKKEKLVKKDVRVLDPVKKNSVRVKNTRNTRSKTKDMSLDPPKDEDKGQEYEDYVLEFGIEHKETVPRIDPNILKQSQTAIETFICSEPVKPGTSTSGRKVSLAREKLEKKIASGNLNENFVRLNMKKKVFVRGKKVFNFSRHKKSLWKKKKAAALAGPEMDMGGCDGGVLSCFNCGGVGHMARQCKIKGDGVLPVTEEEPSPFPTLEEAEVMTENQKLLAHARNPGALPKSGNLKKHEEMSEYEEMDLGSDFEEEEVVRKIIPEDFLTQIKNIETTAGKDEIPPVYHDDMSDTPSEVHTALKLFGHQSFRPGQERAIMRILTGKSTLLTLSTGSGKSLCYQLPAYIYKKTYKRCVTLVISPLVSLMEDQVHGIPSFLNAQCLHTNQTEKQREKIMEMVKDNSLDVLLVSPEAVVAGEKATGFGALLRQLPPIAFACIDEAHCVSQWSHNFRPSYLMICRVLKEKLKVKTILGLTATATKSTRESIINHLGIPDGENGVISDIPLPDNLFLTISKDIHKDIALIELIKSERFLSCNSIIVYCTRREECERVASFIRTSLQDTFVPPESTKRKRVNWIAEPYHAGMAASRRRTIQNAFMSGELRVVVATVAFGMGINKPDIRAVIHYNMPRSFESYVQEVGRAGRDGLPAQCHLFLDGKGNDRNELRRHIYANSIDRPVIRKLLQKVFVPCACKTKCPGHEVAFSVETTVQALDIPEENIATLLCYLELHEQQYVQVLSRSYTRCKILSYGGPSALKHAAQKCPPLAMAIALDMKAGISHESTTTLEFGVIDVAAAIGWDSGVVKYHLKQLEWTEINGRPKRSTISVQFSDLGFRVRSPGDLSDDALDKSLDLLHQRVTSQEKTELMQLQATFEALSSVAFNSHLPATQANCPTGPSQKLKKIIRDYFLSNTLPNTDSLALNDDSDTPDDVLINDIRTMIRRYPENNFTGRALARIFHGVPSPNYPAVIWGRCKFWRVHMNTSFSRIVSLANTEIVRMRL